VNQTPQMYGTHIEPIPLATTSPLPLPPTSPLPAAIEELLRGPTEETERLRLAVTVARACKAKPRIPFGADVKILAQIVSIGVTMGGIPESEFRYTDTRERSCLRRLLTPCVEWT